MRPRPMKAARTGRSYGVKLMERHLASNRRQKPHILARIGPWPGLQTLAAGRSCPEGAAADSAKGGRRLRYCDDVPAVLEAVLIGLVTSQISFIVTTVYLHRALAHKAITLRPPVAFACRFIIWMSTGTRPRQWVAVHRKHHAHTDKEGDPHSPVIFGYSLVQFGNAVLYRRVSKNPEQVDRYAKDLPEDRWDKVLFNHALLGLALGVGLLVAVFGWEIGLIAASGPRLHLPAGRGRHQRHRAQVGQAAARQPGHEQPVAGLARRRRRAAQQPPRRHDLEPDVDGQG